MSKTKGFLLAAAATAFTLSCSEDLKPVERETLEEYEHRLAQASSSSGEEDKCVDSTAYSSETQFCRNNVIYDKCGDRNGNGKHEYDPEIQFCNKNNSTTDKCGGKVYDPPEEVCNGGAVGKLCGTAWYDPSKYYCYNGELRSCGNLPLNPDTQFCSNSVRYDKCGGSEYEPSTHFCLGEEITHLCGSQTYTSSQFCYGNSKIGEYCGNRTVEYNPDLYECKSNINPNGIYLKVPVSYGGKNYEAVLIGTQTWMAENLNYDVPDNTTDVCYSNLPANCTQYGRLYDWSTAMALLSNCNSNTCSSEIQSPHRGICPSGWHIPSREDWLKLSLYVDGTDTDFFFFSATAAKYLKATSGWNNCNGTDDYGFSALPMMNSPDIGWWWSASEASDLAYVLGIYALDMGDCERADWVRVGKDGLSSVRCVKD